MKQLIDFIPLVLFFVFFKLYDIYAGVAALMISSTAGIIVVYFLYKKIDKVMIFTYFMVMFFGALTLIFRNDAFIKWKVTLVYFIFLIGLLFSQFFMKQSILQRLLGREIHLKSEQWRFLTFGWALFFGICGLLNIYIAYCFSQNTWANFKVFWLPGLTLLLSIFTGAYIYKVLPKETMTEKKNNDKV